MTINGTDLAKASVTFGGTAGTVTANTATTITVMSPATDTARAMDVNVVTPGGTTTIRGGFTTTDVKASLAADAINRHPPPAAKNSLSAQTVPTITGVSPASGTTNGGTSVILTGSSFTGATSVTFGGTNAASFTVNSDIADHRHDGCTCRRRGGCCGHDGGRHRDKHGQLHLHTRCGTNRQ